MRKLVKMSCELTNVYLYIYIYINKRPWNGCSITVHEIVVLGCGVLYVDTWICGSLWNGSWMRKRREDLDLAAYDYGFLVCAKGGRGKTVPSFKGGCATGLSKSFRLCQNANFHHFQCGSGTAVRIQCPANMCIYLLFNYFTLYHPTYRAYFRRYFLVFTAKIVNPSIKSFYPWKKVGVSV